MDWLKKLLKGKGLTDEQINEIVKEVETNDKGYVPESRLKEANEAKKQLETDIKDRDKQLNELKKHAGDNEELKKQIEQLQEENKKSTEKHEANLKELRMNAALTMALNGKVHDVDVAKSLIDASKITLGEDGSITSGLDDQVKALRESKAFLFVPEQDSISQFKGFSPFEGQTGGEPKAQNFGEMLAQSVQKGNEGLSQAQENYFK